MKLYDCGDSLFQLPFQPDSQEHSIDPHLDHHLLLFVDVLHEEDHPNYYRHHHLPWDHPHELVDHEVQSQLTLQFSIVLIVVGLVFQ